MMPTYPNQVQGFVYPQGWNPGRRNSKRGSISKIPQNRKSSVGFDIGFNPLKKNGQNNVSFIRTVKKKMKNVVLSTSFNLDTFLNCRYTQNYRLLSSTPFRFLLFFDGDLKILEGNNLALECLAFSNYAYRIAIENLLS